MKRLAILSVIALLLCACNKTKTLDIHTAAQQTAEQYYTYLKDGQYDQFAQGIYAPDSLPQDYCDQLAASAAQLASYQLQLHNGLAKVHALSDSINADSVTCSVLLELTFADSTRENINLPMVLTPDGWKMR